MAVEHTAEAGPLHIPLAAPPAERGASKAKAAGAGAAAAGAGAAAGAEAGAGAGASSLLLAGKQVVLPDYSVLLHEHAVRRPSRIARLGVSPVVPECFHAQVHVRGPWPLSLARAGVAGL